MHYWHQYPLQAARWFNDKFPDRVKYIEERENLILSDELRKQGKTYREWLNEQIEKHEQILSDFGRTLD